MHKRNTFNFKILAIFPILLFLFLPIIFLGNVKGHHKNKIISNYSTNQSVLKNDLLKVTSGEQNNNENLIQTSFQQFFQQSFIQGGESLFAIYNAIGDQDIQSANAAIEANKDGANDLLAKLKQKNNEYLIKRLSGFKNVLSINANDFDNQKFENLYFLSTLTNLNSLDIIDRSSLSSDALLIDKTENFYWINNLNYLEKFKLSNSQFMNLNSPIDLNKNIFSSRNLVNIDLENTFFNDGTLQSLFANFDEESFWYKNKKKNTTLFLPKIFELSNKLTLQETDVDETDFNKIILKKNTHAQFNYLNNKSSENIYSVNIDDVHYERILYKNNYLWNIPLNILASVEYMNNLGDFYTTESLSNLEKMSKPLLNQTYIDLYNNSFTEASKQFNLENDISNTPRDKLQEEFLKVIFVDGNPISSFLKNGILLWNLDPRTIKFASSDLQYFWTSIHNIDSTILETKEISYYKSFETLPDWKLQLQKSEIPSYPDKSSLIYDNHLKISSFYDFDKKTYKFSFPVSKEMGEGSITDFKYYSKNDNAIFSSMDKLISSNYKIMNFIEISDEYKVQDLPIENDVKYKVENITDSNDVIDYINENTSSSAVVQKWLNSPTIFIDNIEYGLILENGIFYVNFPIENIKYIFVDGSNFKYFTSVDKIDASEISKVKIYGFKNLSKPIVKIISKPNFSSSSNLNLIVDDTIIIGATINNNELVWDFTKEAIDLEDIKYVDDKDNYYTYTLKTILDKKGSLPPGLSSVFPETNISLDPPTQSKLLSKILSSDNTSILNNFATIFVDGIEYQREISNSSIRWASVNSSNSILDTSKIIFQTIGQFSDGSANETNHFYSSIKTAKDYSTFFPNNIKRIQKVVSPEFAYNKIIISKPKSASDKLTVYDENNIKHIVDAIEKNKVLFWDQDSSHIIQKIKFAHKLAPDQYEYYFQLNKSKIDSIYDVAVGDNLFSPPHDAEQQNDEDLINDKNTTIYVFAGIAGSVLVVAILGIVIVKLKERRI